MKRINLYLTQSQIEKMNIRTPNGWRNIQNKINLYNHLLKNKSGFDSLCDGNLEFILAFTKKMLPSLLRDMREKRYFHFMMPLHLDLPQLFASEDNFGAHWSLDENRELRHQCGRLTHTQKFALFAYIYRAILCTDSDDVFSFEWKVNYHLLNELLKSNHHELKIWGYGFKRKGQSASNWYGTIKDSVDVNGKLVYIAESGVGKTVYLDEYGRGVFDRVMLWNLETPNEMVLWRGHTVPIPKLSNYAYDSGEELPKFSVDETGVIKRLSKFEQEKMDKLLDCLLYFEEEKAKCASEVICGAKIKDDN